MYRIFALLVILLFSYCEGNKNDAEKDNGSAKLQVVSYLKTPKPEVENDITVKGVAEDNGVYSGVDSKETYTSPIPYVSLGKTKKHEDGKYYKQEVLLVYKDYQLTSLSANQKVIENIDLDTFEKDFQLEKVSMEKGKAAEIPFEKPLDTVSTEDSSKESIIFGDPTLTVVNFKLTTGKNNDLPLKTYEKLKANTKNDYPRNNPKQKGRFMLLIKPANDKSSICFNYDWKLTPDPEVWGKSSSDIDKSDTHISLLINNYKPPSDQNENLYEVTFLEYDNEGELLREAKTKVKFQLTS